jgi:uncharacterized protein YjiS (DUF1127 family)
LAPQSAGSRRAVNSDHRPDYAFRRIGNQSARAPVSDVTKFRISEIMPQHERPTIAPTKGWRRHVRVPLRAFLEEQIMSRQQSPGGDRPLRGLLSGPARLVYEKVIDPMRRRARRRVGVQELAQIDDRLLRDVGLTRAEVHGAAYGLLRLGEPSPAGRMGAPPSTDPSNLVRLERRAIALRVDEATSAPPVKRAAGK